MGFVTFDGPEDARELSSDDFDKGGAKISRDVRFDRGVPVELTDNQAKVLIDHPEIYGRFSAFEGNPDELEGLEEPGTNEGEENAPIGSADILNAKAAGLND